MSIFSNSEFLTLFTTVGVMVLAQAVVFYVYKQNKERRYDEENRRIEMEKLNPAIPVPLLSKLNAVAK